jgi:hypothetical protein
MKRTSFAGALVAVALGAVLAFAIQGSPKDLDLHATGLIIMVAGLADLIIRFAISNSPLLSPETAAVAAVVEPLGEPVLDVFGNPIMPVAPSRGLEPAAMAVPVQTQMPSYGPAAMPVNEAEPVYYDETRPLLPDFDPVEPIGAAEEEVRDRAMAHARARDMALYEQAMAAAEDGDVPGTAVPATTLSGRPIRGRRLRRRP